MPFHHDALANRRTGRRTNRLFWIAMSATGTAYLVLIVGMLVADVQYVRFSDLTEAWSDRRVRYATQLSLITCTISAVLSMWVAVPTGYLLARLGRETIERFLPHRPRLARLLVILRHGLDTLLDIPILLPPLVIGISLLVLFQSPPGKWIDGAVGTLFSWLGFPGIRGITYEIPAIIFAQFTVATAFALRTMRDTFDEIDPYPEWVALTLGASRYQAFARIAWPQAWRGVVAATTLAWARSLGEFGPVLVFAGTARMKTEVLPTTVYLNFQFGNLRGAVAASLILVTLALLMLAATRLLMLRRTTGGSR